jgi:hypothetical protein
MSNRFNRVIKKYNKIKKNLKCSKNIIFFKYKVRNKAIFHKYFLQKLRIYEKKLFIKLLYTKVSEDFNSAMQNP